MKRISTKKDLQRAKNEKIKKVRAVYEEARKKDKSLPPFYKSAAYKDLDKKRRAALRRWDNRKEINARKREKYKIRVEIEKADFSNVSDVSVFEAFSGNGRIFEDAVIQKHRDGLDFRGTVYYLRKTYVFRNYAEFRIKVNAILRELYREGQPSGELFIWRVKRAYSIEGKTVLISYEFYTKSDEENEVFFDDDMVDVEGNAITG